VAEVKKKGDGVGVFGGNQKQEDIGAGVVDVVKTKRLTSGGKGSLN